ncbi:MATE family efflux transporter [Phaeobacter gallaeciensis]|uniref:MATE family efflux transporter n=1 Tax=Phaeobacter gallaeciensis TaxID=60890 RepID=UPI00237F8B04|nr:MATE family efflux transporter [Phaeobacter gallaeciensis]MDE4189846.1 MATE family efflux transporter [Phaeobacter gallaeciensis]MDE4198999.1 MATE family efflux transporter [Phaeobacter gallaeciensis]MDE4203146.1 MATE family efflux transporter [Phaeobacter gallaeciensis]MDE4207288.1 MATE family efflux transporter [Phaeobacter gallaeciensis]MDE4215488.1 MATE family efflux transporter [Phaeobacter gallaeciensis]
MTAASEAPITHSRVLKIAVPIVLSNVTVPILGAVDTGVVGQMGQAAPIGAVGIGAVILATVYWIFGFLRMGTTGLAAQARGAGDMAETGALLMRGLILAALAGGVFILFQTLLFWGAFALAPASAEVETLAREYLTIRIWGAPATIALYAVTGWLIAMERTRGVFILQIWMNGLNILLDLWFVLGLDWGVEGVAAATLIAEWSGLALGLWLCRDAFGGNQWRDWGRVFDPARLRRMLQVNGDIMVRSVLLTGSFTTFLFIGADLGDVQLAANQVLLQFLEITAFALDGFAFSAEALVGGAVGAKSRDQMRRAALLASFWALGGAVALSLAFAFGGGAIIDVMTTSPEVRSTARLFLFWAALAPVLSVASYMLDGVFIGATWTRDMRVAMIQSVTLYVVSLLVLVPLFGNHGLWGALMVLNVARAATLAFRYPRLEASVAA